MEGNKPEFTKLKLIGVCVLCFTMLCVLYPSILVALGLMALIIPFSGVAIMIASFKIKCGCDSGFTPPSSEVDKSDLNLL